MKILIERFSSDKDSTISTIYVDGRFICFGLEDEYREHKVPAETRIPAGVYPIKLKIVGGFHARYKKKFSTFHIGMLHLQDVPGFTDILIHVGNTDSNTAGCLLVGMGAISTKDNMSIQSSVNAYNLLYNIVADAARDDDLTIEIIDRDNPIGSESF